MKNQKVDVFNAGDTVIVRDNSYRTYLLTLIRNDVFETHLGKIPHNRVIGKKPGLHLKTSTGKNIYVCRPCIDDAMLNLQRRGGIIVPKDAAYIIMKANIHPSSRVIEAGTGSGALTLALANTVGKKGRVTGYEKRMDMIETTRANLRAFLPDITNVNLKLKDIKGGFDEKNVDAIILDMPEPWLFLSQTIKSLKPGGTFAAYLPTILQVSTLVNELNKTRTFTPVETVEILIRPWHVQGPSVRPVQRIVSHTGFIVTARLVFPD